MFDLLQCHVIHIQLLLGRKDFSTRNSNADQVCNHLSTGSSSLNWKVVNAGIILLTSKVPAMGQYMNKTIHASCTGSYGTQQCSDWTL